MKIHTLIPPLLQHYLLVPNTRYHIFNCII
nr:MAG TPA: hypothetical protein [Caudoviricetes sp.]